MKSNKEGNVSNITIMGEDLSDAQNNITFGVRNITEEDKSMVKIFVDKLNVKNKSFWNQLRKEVSGKVIDSEELVDFLRNIEKLKGQGISKNKNKQSGSSKSPTQ